MKKTGSVVAVYVEHSLAEAAVNALQKSGFEMKQVSITTLPLLP